MKYEGALVAGRPSLRKPCSTPHGLLHPLPLRGVRTFPVEMRWLRLAISKHSLPGQRGRHSDDKGRRRNLGRIKKFLFSSKMSKTGYAPHLPILFNGYRQFLTQRI